MGAEEEETEVAAGNVQVCEVGGVGLVEVVVAFCAGRARAVDGGEEEVFGTELVDGDGGYEEAGDEGADKAVL